MSERARTDVIVHALVAERVDPGRARELAYIILGALADADGVAATPKNSDVEYLRGFYEGIDFARAIVTQQRREIGFYSGSEMITWIEGLLATDVVKKLPDAPPITPITSSSTVEP